MLSLKVIHYSFLLLISLALANALNLTFKEYIRLAFICSGLVFVYFYLHKKVVRENGPTAFRWQQIATAVLTLNLMFAITQFDPVDGSATAVVPHFWFWMVTSIVILMAFFAFSHNRFKTGNRPVQFKQNDFLVLGICLVVFLLSVGVTFVFPTQEFSFSTLSSSSRIIEYGLLWVIARHAYGYIVNPAEVGRHGLPNSERLGRTKFLLIYATGIYSVVLIGGMYQLGQWIYYGNRGDGFVQSGDRESALVSYEKWLSIERSFNLGIGSEPHLENMAELYWERGDRQAFAEIVEIARRRYPDPLEGHWRIGDLCLKSNAWEMAIPEYEWLLIKGERKQDIIEKLGMCFLKAGYNRALMKLAEKFSAPEISAGAPRELLLMGTITRRLEAYDQASRYLEASVTGEATAYGYYQLGRTQLHQNEVQKAFSSFQKALEIDHDWADVYYHMGICQERIGQIEQARERYQKALTLLPEHMDAYLALSRLGDTPSTPQGIDPDVWVGQRLDDLILVGLKLPGKKFETGDSLNLTLFWQLARDTVATPERTSLLMYRGESMEDASDVLINSGPYFAKDPSSWELGAVHRESYQFIIEGGSGVTSDEPYQLQINLLYDQRDTPSQFFFSWSNEVWCYSEPFFINAIEVEP